MVRYIKQPTKTSCGPTAILNVLKWAGYDATKKDLKKLMRWTRCDLDCIGTPIQNLEQTLKQFSGYRIVKKTNIPEIQEIDEHLEKGGIVLMRYLHQTGGHYALCVHKRGKRYAWVNDAVYGPAKRYRTLKTTQNRLQSVTPYRDGPRIGAVHCAAGFFLEKTDE